jgi:Glycosyl transferase family 2
MTLLVRNEADIIAAQLAFHRQAGVDLVLATDNGSTDETPEVLERFAHDGFVIWERDPDRGLSQVECVTRMARRGATEFGADWVINSDGDEFWWPRGGTLKDVFARVHRRFATVSGMWRHFVPVVPDDGFFAERMTLRLSAPVVDRQHLFNPHFKTAHRASPAITIGGGNHDATGPGIVPLRGWYPIDVLHFPLRSLAQCEQKYVQHYEWRSDTAEKRRHIDPHMAAAYVAHTEGRMEDFYRSLAVDKTEAATRLRNGTLARDTRLRDALRTQVAPLPRETFDVEAVDPLYVSELGTLEDHSQLARAQSRLERLERRVAVLESRLLSRLRARLAQ